MNNDDSVNDVESDETSNTERDLENRDTDTGAREANETVTPSSPRTREQEAEELNRKIAEIERKVADGN